MTLSRYALGTLLVAQLAASPGQVGQPRDAPSRAPEDAGTGQLSGRVVAADDGKPLRRAHVRVTSPALDRARAVSTDADGRWSLGALPAGRYAVSVSKEGYITLSFGQRRPFQEGTAIDLAHGQTLNRIDISLPRGSAIEGRILDEFGDPFAGVRVSALRYRYVNGHRRLVPVVSSDATDDVGHYRLYGLSPGEYYIYAARSHVDLGTLSDEPTNYTAAYFPGTTRASEAQRIVVSLGEELREVTFSLPEVRVSTVSGIVLTAEGTPPSHTMVQLSTTDPLNPGYVRMISPTLVRPDGRFTIPNVMPGKYRIDTVSVADIEAVAATGTTAAMGFAESASADLVVTGDDIHDLVLVSKRGATASGRIRFEGGIPPGMAPSTIGLAVLSATEDGPPARSGGVQVYDNWTFEARGLTGRRLFRVSGAAGWTLKAVTFDGTDVTDSGIAFLPGAAVAGVDLVLTRSTVSLTGTVMSESGRPARDYVVVAFSQDRSRWGVGTRFVKASRPDQSGAFAIEGLPPAEYFLVALDDLEPGEEGDAGLLERLSPSAERVTVVPESPGAVTLRLGRMPD